MKKIFLLIAFAVGWMPATTQAQSTSTQGPSWGIPENMKEDPEKKLKSSFLSLVLSAALPGLGQYYNGTENEIVKGAIQTTGTWGLILIGRSYPSYDNIILIPPIVGCYLWSIIDAPITSADINGKVMGEMKSRGESFRRPKSADDAMALSMLLPGAGQYYNGTGDEIVKGIIQESALVGGLALDGATVTVSSDPGSSNTSGNAPTDAGRIVAGLSIALAAYLWSVIDAPLAADDINRKAGAGPIGGHFGTGLTMFKDSASRFFPAAEMSLKF